MASLLLVLLSSGTSPAQEPRRLTLQQAEEIAVKNHPAIRAARFSALATAAIPSQIASGYYPTVNGNFTGAGAPEGSRIAAGGLNNPIIYSRLASGFSINQLLLDFGRTSHLLAGSKLRAQAEDEVTSVTRAQVIIEVDRAYYAALRSEAVLRVAEQTIESRQFVADQAAELEKAGLKSSLDASFARVSLEEARLLRATALNERQQAYAYLAAALGYSAAQTMELADEPFHIEPYALEELIARARRDRPELHVQSLQAEAAEQTVQAERAAKYPSVSAMASAGWLPEHDSALRGRYGAAGVNLTLPFLNGGLYKARETEARMRAQAARERLEELELRIVRDVTVALLEVNSAAERVGLSASLLDQAAQALYLAQSRYDLGLSSIVELSQAQLARTSAAIQNANAKYDYQFRRSVLEYQTGSKR